MRRRMKQGVLAVVAIVAGIVAGGVAWRHRSDAPPATAAAAAPPRVAAPPSPVRPNAVLPASISIHADAPPVRVQVERLLASHDPRQAHTAYWLVAGCASFNTRPNFDIYDDKLRAYRPLNAEEKRNLGKVCGDLTERERQARLDYLAIAFKAGLPGAAWNFAVEGPFGDPSALKTRPDDPLVREWKAAAVAQLNRAAEAGDPTTLLVWSMQSLNGSNLADKNPALAYRYLIAFGMINGDQFGPNNMTAKVYADGSATMNGLQVDLTPEQRAIEQARRGASRMKSSGASARMRQPGRQPSHNALCRTERD